VSIHIALLGGGGISETHARAAQAIPGVQVVAVHGQDEERVRRLAESCGAAPYRELGPCLRHRPLDLVMIGSPSGLHGEQGQAAAEQGLHVLVEKPLEISLARALGLVETADRHGVRLGVCFQDRTSPVLLALKRLIDEGHLGRPHLVAGQVRWYRPPEYYGRSRWRGTWALDGGGALMNQGIHTVDLLIWLLGDIARVSALSRTALHRIEVEDTIVAVLEFAGGAVGTLEATTAAYPGYPRRVQISGSAGSVTLEQDRVVSLDLQRPVEFPLAGATQSGPLGASPAVLADFSGHRRILEDFLTSLATGRPPLCEGREGCRSVAVVEAAYESARRGAPVEVRSSAGETKL
jgi:UDP-N-acetyl-2-amino-2-deoxyglucuronate dehydrogenase